VIYGFKPKASTKVPIKKYVVIIAIAIALITPSVCGAYLTSEQVVPGTSDPMWNSMQWINETQPADTVITSWWDFGYLFEIAADKQVTFDGGSQTGSRAFWLGQAMSTDNLELSAGIFRMLDTTGERATAELVNITGDSGKSVDILIDILPRTSDDAQKTLVSKYHLNSQQAATVVNFTHPDNPRPVIFVASYDMLGKAGWWSYFGAWNFENQTSENYNYYVPTSQVTVKPGQTGNLSLLNANGMLVNAVIERGSGNNTTTAHVESLNAATGEKIMVNDTEYNPLKASNLIVIEDGYLMKNESLKNASDGNYTLFLMGNNNEYTPILISNELTDSMFTRLYLMGGAGQEIFSNVHSENGVMLFQVNFDKTAAGGASSSGNSTA
jgi:dolichyl-diphosphooligosaccharide--protein glycosyltransferase